MKSHTQKRTRILGVFAGFSLALTPIIASVPALAVTRNAEFRVNVTEILSVSLTLPDNWASGDTGDFLRNAIHLDVASNNGNGFTASMTTKTSNTSLMNKNSAATIPTLQNDAVRSSFPANYWGYSIDDTAAGNASSVYKALAGAGDTPISLITSGSASSASKDVYFGAKADSSKDSGTYSNTVVFNVVADVIDVDNPVTPVDPATPSDASQNNPAYDSSNNRTVYTATTNNSNNNTTTTITEVSSGDNRSSYTNPQGVKSYSDANIGEGTPLATGLAVTAGIAATAGVVFFVAAKRKERKDEEEKQQ